MQPLYDVIGLDYFKTRRADPAIAHTLGELLALGESGVYLDMACGTGNYTTALAGKGGVWHGLDISETMIKQARASRHHITWRLSSATTIPYADNFFDGIVCTLAIHHFPGLQQSFKECHRVLNRGKFVLFTAFPKQMRGYWLCHYFPEMMKNAIKQMPTEAAVSAALISAGFKIEKTVPFCVTNQLQDLFLYSGKTRPELYFDPEVRANISSFSLYCPHKELVTGLEKLKQDVCSGEFLLVAERYRIGQGDYAFVVANK